MYASTNAQLTLAKSGTAWRCTTSTRSAPWSHSSAAHSYALCRPPMITTRAPANPSNATMSLVCPRRAGGTSAYQAGRLTKCRMPGAASTVSAAIVEPSSSVATKPPSTVDSSVTRRSSTSRPLRRRNQSV